MFPYKPTRSSKLDPIDDEILQAVGEGCTLQEMADRVGKSVNGVKWRMQPLIEQGYLIYNPRRARARELTEQAKEYMRANGLAKVRIFE